MASTQKDLAIPLAMMLFLVNYPQSQNDCKEAVKHSNVHFFKKMTKSAPVDIDLVEDSQLTFSILHADITHEQQQSK